MESSHLLIDGGLIIKHIGVLRAEDLKTHFRKLLAAYAFDHAKYVVSDFSEISEIVFMESQGSQLGEFIRELRGSRITLCRPIRWAVVTVDQRIVHLASCIAKGSGGKIYLRDFNNVHEGFLWGKNPMVIKEISDYLALNSSCVQKR